MSTQPEYEQRPPLADVVAANVRARAAYLGLSQVQLANALGWSKTTVQQRWHNGSRPWKLEDLELLAPILEIEPYELLQPDMTNGSPKRTAVPSTPSGTRTLNPLIKGDLIDFDDFMSRRAA